MNPTQARSLIRWALTHPNEAEQASKGAWDHLKSVVPTAAATTAAYLLSEWVAKKLNLSEGAPADPPRLLLPPMPIPAEALTDYDTPKLAAARAVLAKRLAGWCGT